MTQNVEQNEMAVENIPGDGETECAHGASQPVENQADETGLSARQRQLLTALVATPDVQAAAKAVGVPRSTAHYWLKQPAFQKELALQRDAVLYEALDSVKAHTTQAVTEMAKLLTSSDERLRRQVCNDILGHAVRVREMENIERRIAALEEAVEENRKLRRHS